ncbi:short chain dehydrogenase family protein [Eubacterium limosum]|nr:short chain dehydrogenase family protein [Eubacterium limosum]
MGLKNKIKNTIQFLMMSSKKEKVIPIISPVDRDKALEGKVALITGGSSGIGLEIAKSFVASGAKVIIAGKNENKLIEAVKEISKQIEAVRYIVIDVTNTVLIEKKVWEAAMLFKENKIDILVNSAGVVAHNSFMNMDEVEYDRIMDTNAKGTFFMSQAVSQLMIKKKIKGHILNVTSSSALRPAWTPYQMSKWAIRGFTMGLADVLLQYGIIVNAIAPGPTATPMLDKKEGDTIYNEKNPAGRYIIPCEIAALAVFMVSGAGDMVVGDTFYITGGSGTISYHR